MNAPALRVRPWLGLVFWLVLVAATGAVGAVASARAAEFYASLTKPSWAPPAEVFGPVWSLLYLLMAIAAWLVWRERGWSQGRIALGLFVFQLALNAAWSWLFFGWHLGGLAFADIVVLLILIAATLAAFSRVQRLAAWLLVPYLAWVGFAAALNFSVWQLNPQVL